MLRRFKGPQSQRIRERRLLRGRGSSDGRDWKVPGPGKEEHPRQKKPPGLRLEVGKYRSWTKSREFSLFIV